MRQFRSQQRLIATWRVASPRSRAHQGVTVLEVLFSIGIVTVGLLGVMIIVPLAGLRTTQGAIADGADRLGRSAIRQFDVYQMRRPDSWAQLNPATGNYVAFTGGEAFCIDPLYMDANSTTVGIFRFPYLGTGIPPAGMPWMTRVTLRSSPGGAVTSVMSVSQAGEIFLGGDDLVFNLPKDRSLAPQQKYDFGGTSTTDGLKRQWEGKFSWLAVVVPKLGASSDTYVLSIVVFHRRESLVDAERTVSATPPVGTTVGYNGGDVLLSAALEDDLKMKEGEWLMLTGMDASSQEHFRWYRIQTADGAPVLNSAGTAYERDVTLFGQDWPFSLMTGSSGTRAVWIPGVVAVYEKIIRLETSSMWTDLKA